MDKTPAVGQPCAYLWLDTVPLIDGSDAIGGETGPCAVWSRASNGRQRMEDHPGETSPEATLGANLPDIA